jgi:hypothetical protein
MKVKDLKPGCGINHSKYGYLQYHGLVTKHPFTDKPVIWQPVDENGNTTPDVVLTDGEEVVELID